MNMTLLAMMKEVCYHMWESIARGRGIWEWRSELCSMRKGRGERREPEATA